MNNQAKNDFTDDLIMIVLILSLFFSMYFSSRENAVRTQLFQELQEQNRILRETVIELQKQNAAECPDEDEEETDEPESEPKSTVANLRK